MLVEARPEFSLEEAVEPIEGEWVGLWQRCGAVPFVHPGWVRAWCAAAGAEPAAAAVRRDGHLVALLPVVRTPGRILTPADWHTPVVEALAADDGALHALASGMASLAPAAVTLDFVEAGSSTTTAFIEALRSAGYRVVTRGRMRSPFIGLSGGVAGYFDGLETRKLRELRRRRRRLDEAGEVRFEVSDGRAGLDGLLDEVFAVEAAGWKGAQGTAILSDRRVEAMYRSAAAWAAEGGMLVVGALRLDGRMIAADLALEAGGVHYLLKTGFDPEAGSFAPAMQLRAYMIERAFEAGLQRYEFAGTDDPWKLEWTGTVRPIVRIDAYSAGIRGGVARLSDTAARRARALGRRMRR